MGSDPTIFWSVIQQFDFSAYKEWIDQRFEPRKFAQLDAKMGNMVKYAIGAFIQALGQNPGIEEKLQELGTQTHIYVGTGLGDLATNFQDRTRLLSGPAAVEALLVSGGAQSSVGRVPRGRPCSSGPDEARDGGAGRSRAARQAGRTLRRGCR